MASVNSKCISSASSSGGMKAVIQVQSTQASTCRALIGGISGGVVSTLALHPLELIKTRLAAGGRSSNIHTWNYTGVCDALGQIAKQEGAGALYRGLVPNVLVTGSGWGFHFLFYHAIKQNTVSNGEEEMTMLSRLGIAAEAGALTLILTNPINVVKTRLCLQQSTQTSDASKGIGKAVSNSTTTNYTGVVDSLRQIHKNEGLRGFYKGFFPSLLQVSHGALQLMIYEELKCRIFGSGRGDGKTTQEKKLGTPEYLVCASVSKVLAALPTYPLQLLRTRLQDRACEYKGLTDAIRVIATTEGPRGFYRGLAPYLMHVMPNICLVFLVYETIVGSQ